MNRNDFGFAFLLNLLVPGIGHGFWKEYAFGVFVFLVMILSVVLAMASLLLPFSALTRAFLIGLPALYYIFTFVDLRRVVRKKRSAGRTYQVTAAFLIFAILWQLLSPAAPVNFLARNAPEVFRLSDNALSPRLRQGSWLYSNSLAYRANFFFISRPQLYALPERGELVRFADSMGVRHVGLVIGFPGEQVEIIGRTLTANGVDFDVSDMFGAPLSGTMALTPVESGSIMVAMIRIGMIETTHQVAVTDILGKVHELL
ncbi:MAG: hypothetical protein HY851_05010 [candidate division Zixibacteria bacterium]|nr:hypothetical protein [candidate division Zixibacteria bacterium]